MKPKKMKLQNFLSYGDSPSQEIDLEGVRIAALVGRNGSGKSSILDAITWTLFGIARGTDMRGAYSDKLVRIGSKKPMSVEIDFELENSLYRVTRKLQKTRRGQKINLNFKELSSSGKWVSLQGNTTQTTQQAINKRLRMKYETFTGSSFILQNRIDTFVQLKPRERKELLAEILGLGMYEDLLKMARDDFRTNKEKRKIVETEKKSKETLIGEKEATKTAFEQISSEIVLILGEKAKTRDALDQVREEISKLKEKAVERSGRENQVKTLKEETKKTSQKLSKEIEEVQKKRDLLARSDEITSGKKELNDLKKLWNELTVKWEEKNKISDELRIIETEINTERIRLEEKFLSKGAELAKMSQLRESLPGLRLELQANKDKLSGFDQKEANEIDPRKKLLSDANKSHSIKKLELDKVTREGEESQGTISLLITPSAEAICPTCRQGLSQELRNRIVNELTERLKGVTTEKEKLRSEIWGLETQKTVLTEDLEEKIKEISEQKDSIRDAVADSQAKINSAEEEITKIDETQQELHKIRNQLDQKTYAEQRFREKEQVQEKIEELGFSEKQYEDVKTKISENEKFDQEFIELKTAREDIKDREENITLLEQENEDRRQKIEEEEEMITSLNEQIVHLPDARKKLPSLKIRLKTTEKKLLNAESTRSVYQDKLDRIIQAEADLKRFQEELKELAGNQEDLEFLIKMFSKDGIPAVILENSIPEIENEAQFILRRLTDGRMNVLFKTQKALKSDPSRMRETLDIEVADERGTRSIDLYSGGESFVANFAIRVALSKVLARRSGAPLQTLVIDEGFGSQDRPSRQKLVELIKKLQDDFEVILVISHMEGIQEQFLTQFHFEKTPSGTVVTAV